MDLVLQQILRVCMDLGFAESPQQSYWQRHLAGSFDEKGGPQIDRTGFCCICRG